MNIEWSLPSEKAISKITLIQPDINFEKEIMEKEMLRQNLHLQKMRIVATMTDA